MKLILHVGMHKTGTSALQALLRSQGESLFRNGVLYPKHGQHHDGAHHELWRALLELDATETFVSSVMSEVEAAPCKISTVILSSELLEKIGNDPRRANNIHHALGPFDSVHVIYFVRNQAELIQSVFKQWVKDDAARLALGPTEFLQKHGAQLFYSRYADWWRSLGSNISLSLALYSGSWSILKADFMRLTGLCLEESVASDIYNVSMDGERLKLKHWLNRNVPVPYLDFPVNPWLVNNFKNTPRTTLFKNREELYSFQDQFREDNRVLADRWNLVGIDECNVSGGFFQTAGPDLVRRFFVKLRDDPGCAQSNLLEFRT